MQDKIKHLKLGVLTGGISPERDVCMLEGEEIYQALKESGCNITKIVLTDTSDLEDCYQKICSSEFDFVFLSVPEDVPIQDVLDMLDIPYNGSGRLATPLSMDKVLTKQLMQSYGMLTPRYAFMREEGNLEIFREQIKNLQLPVVIKPANLGTSIGVSIATSEQEVGRAIDVSRQHSSYLLAEEFIAGTEITVPIINDKFFGIVEIHSFEKLYSNQAKMDNRRTLVCPSTLPQKTQTAVQEQANQIYKVLGCEGLARIDGIVSEGKFYFLEVNTLPFLVGECAPIQVAKTVYNLTKLDFLSMIITERIERQQAQQPVISVRALANPVSGHA